MEKNISISYTILACNEHIQLIGLLNKLLLHKSEVDEVHVILDSNNVTNDVRRVIETIQQKYDVIKENFFVWENPLNKDFAAQKNFAGSKCKGDYIFNIDADEQISEYLMENIHQILQVNSDVNVMYVPRINIVHGITENHLRMWNWSLNIEVSKEFQLQSIQKFDIKSEEFKLLDKYELLTDMDGDLYGYYQPVIQFPDYQMRIYKNTDKIRWVNPVHEVLTGHKNQGYLPSNNVHYCIMHEKDITRQEAQNNFYTTI